MKKFTKIISLVSCVFLLSMIFAGCGQEPAERVQTDGTNFSFWTVLGNGTMESYDEMLFYQVMEEKTGIHIDFIHPIKGSTGSEAFITMVSGTKLPDMIQYDWLSYTGGPQAAIDDNTLICLNDYLEEYAPNFYNYMEGEEAKKRNYGPFLAGTTEKGNYYGFNVLNLGATKGFSGLYVRGDLLDKWGMETPEIIDDWTAYFAKAKEEGYSKPLTGGNAVLTYNTLDSNSFNTAYGVAKSFYIEGDKVIFSPFEKGFKEYLDQMAKWYAAGYIDPGIITNDGMKIESNIVNGESVASFGYIGSALGKYGPALAKIDPTYELRACPYPVAKRGEIAEFQQVCKDATAVAIGITTQCGNYEKAIGWCDWIFSEEGIPTQLFGKEGDTYTVEIIDGEEHFIYTDKVLDYEKAGFSSLSQSMYHYGLPANSPGYNQHDDYILNYYQEQYQKDALKAWNLPGEKAVAHAIPGITFTPEESEEIADIKELVEAPFEVFMYDIIRGKISIDEYDEGCKKYGELGFDRYLEIYQAAYDRYISKKDLLNK